MTDEKKRFRAKKAVEQEDISEDVSINTTQEQLVLARVLNEPALASALKVHSSHEMFINENHKCIAWTILHLHSKGVPINVDTIDSEKSNYPGTKTGTTFRYLTELKESYKDECTLEEFKVLVDRMNLLTMKRRVLNEPIVDLFNSLKNPHSSAEHIQKKLADVVKSVNEYSSSSENGFKSLAEIIPTYEIEVQKRLEVSTFGSTGYIKLDHELTVGFGAKKVSIIAGRPGMAKSALATNCMLRLARNNVPVAMFAMEMDHISITDRLVAIETRISLEKIVKNRKNLSPRENERIKEALNRLKEMPIYIDQTPTMTMEELESKLTKQLEKQHAKVVFIDLFMKIQKPKYSSNRNDASIYSDMLNHVQRIAKNLDTHLCLVVQIGRKAESRTDKRPMLSDLKDSGAYEEVADLVLLLYRDKYYKRGEQKNQDVKEARKNLKVKSKLEEERERKAKLDMLEIHIAKQREGKQNEVVEMPFYGDTTYIGFRTLLGQK